MSLRAAMRDAMPPCRWRAAMLAPCFAMRRACCPRCVMQRAMSDAMSAFSRAAEDDDAAIILAPWLRFSF